MPKARRYIECKKPASCDSRPIYVGEFELNEIIHTKVFNLRCENTHINHYVKLDLKTETDLESKLKRGYVDRSKEFAIQPELKKHMAKKPQDKDSARLWLQEAERILETHYLADSPILGNFIATIGKFAESDEKVNHAREYLDEFLNKGCQ